MDYLLGASLSSFIAACVAVLVLEPRVQSGERPALHWENTLASLRRAGGNGYGTSGTRLH